ncbi:uncharacterized protein LOC127843966 [Dreissena polymorpha]|uniref:Uncharacterized protein n=1 Tax=Dreissena polymorpha TaxID=45954 RepID=A0A9D4EBR4_DREPO|nr:uncharacterized protein LOC127843966 [Dreissena polymorpha]KAH3776413.1 hypothetical protein DPMN_177836 [Dreissena polymorpha]
MDDKLVFRAFLYAVLVISVNAQPWNTYIPCNTTTDCLLDLCCRDAEGNLPWGEGGGFPDDVIVVGGTCWYGPSKPGTICSQQCGCGAGYTCYKTITGACCPPTTCWDAKEAAKDKKYWDKCFEDPKCPLPP